MDLNQLIAEYESKKDSYSPEKQAQIEGLIQQAQAKYGNQKVSVTGGYSDAQGNRREEYSDGTTKMVEAAPKKVSAPVATKTPVKKQTNVNNNVNVPETVEQPNPVTLYNVYQNAKNNGLLEDYYKGIAGFDASKLTTQLMNEGLSDEQISEWMSGFRDYVSSKEQNSKKSNNQNINNQNLNNNVDYSKLIEYMPGAQSKVKTVKKEEPKEPENPMKNNPFVFDPYRGPRNNQPWNRVVL